MFVGFLYVERIRKSVKKRDGSHQEVTKKSPKIIVEKPLFYYVRKSKLLYYDNRAFILI